MKNYTKLQLIDQEIKRIQKLNRISDRFKKQEEKSSISTKMNTFYDYMKAQADNEESFNEVITGISPEVIELHFRACEDSGIIECVCKEIMAQNRIMEATIL